MFVLLTEKNVFEKKTPKQKTKQQKKNEPKKERKDEFERMNRHFILMFGFVSKPNWIRSFVFVCAYLCSIHIHYIQLLIAHKTIILNIYLRRIEFLSLFFFFFFFIS